MHLIDRIDLFKISNFGFGWNGYCNGFVWQLRDLYSSLEG